jgi:hypothetical protein
LSEKMVPLNPVAQSLLPEVTLAGLSTWSEVFAFGSAKQRMHFLRGNPPLPLDPARDDRQPRS